MSDAMEQQSHSFPRQGNWTSGQLKLAFYFYCQTPFGKLHSRNPEIVELASLIGRTPDALAMKLVNFASLDPSITDSGRTGLRGASKLDRQIWDEFHADWERLALDCEQLRLSLLSAHGLRGKQSDKGDPAFELSDFTGETRSALVQQRVKQRFFRRSVLSSYRGRCCISRVSEARLLVASHIVAWSEDRSNRLNPSNGLCLSAIHDKAFDAHLFTLSDDHRIVLSAKLRGTNDAFLRDVFWPVEGQRIELPERFLPDKRFVERHREMTSI